MNAIRLPSLFIFLVNYLQGRAATVSLQLIYFILIMCPFSRNNFHRLLMDLIRLKYNFYDPQIFVNTPVQVIPQRGEFLYNIC
jgi:hypothetical protein